MIKIVTGKLGAGKSLYCVTEIVDILCEGRTVCANIDIQWPEMKAYCRRHRGVHLQDSQFVRVDLSEVSDWHRIIPWGVQGSPVAVYLDEIHLFFNARDWQGTANTHKELLSFLTQSRKACCDVTFISQDIATIEKQFRLQAEYEYFAVNTDHMRFGPLGKLPWKSFIVIVRDANNGKPLDRLWRAYDPKMFSLYRSYQMLDSTMQALESAAKRVAPLKLRKVSFAEKYLHPIARHFAPLLGFLRIVKP